MKINLIILFFILFFLLPATALSGTKHLVYFENTDYELHVYKIYGIEEGQTLMIIGGIQGDEPGAYLAADLYADMALRKGNMIVVPRANFLSIIRNKRLINDDMNRRFDPANSNVFYEDRVVEILKELISESDFLLNLHEGSGFYSHKWESHLVNPMRYGQSIIADANVFETSDGEVIPLGDIAVRVAKRANRSIANRDHHFKFSNHNTFANNTKHPEQRGSATFFALSRHHMPSFGIETSKEIKDIKGKVRYQTLVVNSFLNEFDIIPESPKIALDPPELKYVIVSLNDSSILLNNGDTLDVKKGDRVSVTGVEANYKRGLSLDLIGLGTANDIGREFTIHSSVKAIVRKDNFKCGEVRFSATGARGIQPSVKQVEKRFKYLIVEVNGIRRVLQNNEHLSVVRGDTIKLVEALSDGIDGRDVKVNFVGFVSDVLNNNGEDRGALINTAEDLWVKYSTDKRGMKYKITVTENDRLIGSLVVEIEEPEMEYIVFNQNIGGKRWYSKDEVITISTHDRLEVVDVKTNVQDNRGVMIFLSSSSHKEGKIRIEPGESIPYEYLFGKSSGVSRIFVTRKGLNLGKIDIRHIDSVASKGGKQKNRVIEKYR